MLKEIAGPTIHPKVSRVLLERNKPDAALMILRCTGLESQAGGNRLGDGDQATLLPLTEAVTTLRIFVQNGQLTEGFLFQRAHWKKLRADESRSRMAKQNDAYSITEDRKWSLEMDILVGEMCWVCARNGALERMLQLPWQAEEEKIVRKCLLEQASQDPSSSSGNLLAVFYLQVSLLMLELFTRHLEWF